MYRRILAVIMSAALVVSGLTITPSRVDASVYSSAGSGSWGLVWSDEFNQNAGTSPNSNYWQYDIGNGSSGWGNNEIQYYTNSTSNVAIENVDGAVDGKALRITAKRENGQITSARIKSLDKQYVKYGRVEARIKTSNGMQPGVWPAFWMMGNDINTNGMGWPLCGEIDIMEHRNRESEVISTLHWNSGSSYNHSYYGSELNGAYGYVDTMDNWHTYALEWYEDCMKFFLDGNCYETITLTSDMAEEFHKPHFILLNLAIGGTNTPFTKNTTVTNDWQTSSMYVDYVRVYQGSDGNFYRAQTSDTSDIQTTASPTAGMTACASDGWYGAGSVWDYNFSASWAQASGYYAGGSQNDFTIYISNPSLYEWGSMIRARQGVTAGHSYNYTINYNSNKAGSALIKEDVSQTGDQTVGIVSGNGTINGSFKAGASQTEAQILMDLRGFSAGTKIKITGLTLTDTSSGATTTTQAPTTKAEGDYTGTTIDWSGISYAGDGAGGGSYSNKYKFYCENSNVSLVNIQESFGTEAGLYVTFPSGLSSSTLGGYAIQGAGALFYLSALTAKETKFTVIDGGGTRYTCYVYYADGSGTVDITDETPVTTAAPETTTVAASDLPSGFISATTNDWSTAGSWGCYFGDWNGSASGAYQLVSNTNYKLYFKTANTGADWLVQARYDAEAVSGHTYKVTATITTDKAGSIGIKEDLSNSGVEQVYTNLPVGTTTVIGEYTVTQDNIRVMFELGRGISAGTTLSFDNIVIEDITESETTAPGEEPTASSYIRTVHIDTYGGTISSDKKIDCGIVIMDKVGGDSYEDTVVYDTIDSTGTIKIRGNSTSLADKKPYNISFSSKTEVFGMGSAKKWSLLANAFDKSLVRNRLAMEFASDMGLAYTSESTYVDLYVNGVYYGNYLLIESVEVGKDRVDIDVANESDVLVEREAERNEEGVVYFTTNTYGVRFAMDDPEEIDTASVHYANMLSKFNGFEAALTTGAYDTVAQYIDIDSFANFYIVNELFKNVDFNYSSTRFYIKNGKIYAGPLWDLDLSSGNALSSYYPSYYPNGDSAQGLWCQNFIWFRVLMEIPEFKDKVEARYTEAQPLIANMISGTTGNSIDALTNTYATAFEMNYTAEAAGGAGWSVSQADSADYYSKASEAGWQTYKAATDYLKEWLTSRNTFLLKEFAKESLAGVTANSTKIDGITYKNLVKDTGVTVTSSSNESDDKPPTLAIDGNEGTRWASARNDNQQLIIDLGAEYNIKGLSILWEAASAATYAVKVSTNGTSYTEVAAYTSSEGARKDDIVLNEEAVARYVMIDCYTRTTIYGFSIYELAVWGSDVSNVPISRDIEINGFQISTLVEGIRTVYSVDNTVEGQQISEVGLIYGIETEGFSKDDMVYGSDNQYVYTSVGTANGKLDHTYSKSASYAMTMTFGGNNAMAYNAVYYVRAYAKLSDGTIVYTNLDTYTVYDVADRLYRSCLMSTAIGHEYLYDKILHPLNNSYKKVDYNWVNILAPAEF